jgi:hypothetical protein
MRPKTYFFSIFTLVLLTGGLVGVLKVPHLTVNVAMFVLSGVIAIGLVILAIALSFTQGPQE